MKQNSTIKQQALRTEAVAETTDNFGHSSESEGLAASAATASDNAQAEELDERILVAAQAANDKKALDTVLLDLRSIASFTDYFLITSGTNARQVQAIADAVVDTLKKQGTRASRVEGYKSAEWVLVDYGDFVVHVFDDKSRRFYDLERLWRDAKPVGLPSDDAAKTDESEGHVGSGSEEH